jgi:hypothetical protein
MKPFSVLYMQRALALILCLSPAAFVASPLTADDLYGAPDPGWYNQGSGWSPDAGSGWGGSGYGFQAPAAPYSDAGFGDTIRGGVDDYSGPYGYDPDYRSEYKADYGRDDASPDGDPWSRRSDPEADTPDFGRLPEYGRPDSRRSTLETRQAPTSPDGYGAPDWAQPRDTRQGEPERYDRGRPPGDGYARDRFRDAPATQRSWPDRGAGPRYRFRDDPAIEQRYGGSSSGDFRFRPLTERERDRQRSSGDDPRFVDRDRDRDRSPYRGGGSSRPQAPARDSAFGYEPDAPGDDFYRRYYRSGP